MRFLLLTVLISFLSSLSLAQTSALVIDPSSFLQNPIATTVLSAFASPEKENYKVDYVTVLPARRHTFPLEELGRLKITYRLQKSSSAPLAFIVPGTGGYAESGGALYMSEKLYQLGYTTVTLDNPFSYGFAVAGSTRGLPGYAPEDGQDLYKALQKVARHLRHERGLKPQSYSLLGYSLGALHSAFVQRLDAEAHHFNFKHVVLINPPTNLLRAVGSVDHLYNIGDSFSAKRKKEIMFRIYAIGEKYLTKDSDLTDPRLVQRIFDELGLQNEDLSYLIGESFRGSVRDVIYSSQQVNDLGILKSPISRYKRNQRIDEASRYSFTQYMNLFLLPELQKNRGADYSIRELNEESSLYQFAEMFRSSANIYLLGTADDLMVAPQDIAWFKQQFGSRATIFPYGGHCGQITFPPFKSRIKEIFAK